MKKYFVLALSLVSMSAIMSSCSNGEAEHVMDPKPTVTSNAYSSVSIRSHSRNGETETTVTKAKGDRVTTEISKKSITEALK